MPQPEFLTLKDAQPGTNYYIVENSATGRTRSRLDSLGLVSGEDIRVLYANFSGFVISIKGSRLALSRGVAKGLTITPFTEDLEFHQERRAQNRQERHQRRERRAEDRQNSQNSQNSQNQNRHMGDDVDIEVDHREYNDQDRRNPDRPDRRDPNRVDRRRSDCSDRRSQNRNDFNADDPRQSQCKSQCQSQPQSQTQPQSQIQPKANDDGLGSLPVDRDDGKRGGCH
jgi:Fe2+ transport system protein FeoA